jgi:YHS domain-containing protein
VLAGSRQIATIGISLMYLAADAQEQGIWKSYVPPAGSMRGEFQNSDPVALAAGAEIKADCSFRWINPTDQKLYCFSSGTSLETFLDAPQIYIAQAREGWAKLHPPGK